MAYSHQNMLHLLTSLSHDPKGMGGNGHYRELAMEEGWVAPRPEGGFRLTLRGDRQRSLMTKAWFLLAPITRGSSEEAISASFERMIQLVKGEDAVARRVTLAMEAVMPILRQMEDARELQELVPETVLGYLAGDVEQVVIRGNRQSVPGAGDLLYEFHQVLSGDEDQRDDSYRQIKEQMAWVYAPMIVEGYPCSIAQLPLLTDDDLDLVYQQGIYTAPYLSQFSEQELRDAKQNDPQRWDEAFDRFRAALASVGRKLAD